MKKKPTGKKNNDNKKRTKTLTKLKGIKLTVKDVNLSSGGPLVAIINENDAEILGLKALDRIRIRRLRSKKCVTCVVDISSKGIGIGEIGLFEELLIEVGVEEGTHVNVELSGRPKSIMYIKAKLEGKKFTKEQIDDIISDIIQNRLSEVEITYFVSGCYINGLDMKETAALTNAIVNSGDKLHFEESIVVDKHCIGGVPNNRTTMIVVPIMATLGFKIPKTSSRAITSPAGTADTMETICPVSLEKEKILEVIKKTNGCIVWGGAINLAGADDILIKIRHPLRIDPRGMLLASILAKKKAVGSTHVLIDIPFGNGAKIANKKDAKELGRDFINLGGLLGLKLKVVYTDGSQPIGNGIGPALEVNDVISVLKNDGPNDLREKSIYLATELLKLIGVKKAEEKVHECLNSGKALEKFIEIVRAQGGKKSLAVPKAKYSHSVKAEKEGTIKEINNKSIALIARLAGAPHDKAAGLYLRVHKGDKVKKGNELFTIYSNNMIKLDSVIKTLHELRPIIY